jgi:hypothetical protein
MKYIGISSTVINDCFICYIALSSGILKWKIFNNQTIIYTSIFNYEIK